MHEQPAQPTSPVNATQPDTVWRKQEVTRLLMQWREGDAHALSALTPLVYKELRQLAQRYMRKERRGHTLQATAVVHEAFVRMVDLNVPWQDRSHFLAIAANMMRRILVDHAKGKRREKRGGGVEMHSLSSSNLQLVVPETASQFDLVEIDEAINRLAEFDERSARVIELYYFGGLTAQEIAVALSVSEPTINRDLRLAKAWLLKELRHHAPGATDPSSSSDPHR